MKRWREPKAKPGEIKIQYGRVRGEYYPDLCFVWGSGTSRSDARLLHNVIASERYRFFDVSNSLLDELEKRGYDLTTLNFSIFKKQLDNK